MMHAKNGSVRIGDDRMDYIAFGSGDDSLVMLPGLGDGLSTVRGKALALAISYRIYAKRYRVYLFSRRRILAEGYTTRDMARDQAEAMRVLGISRAHVMGISQGGMIAQHLAIDHPGLIDRLILAVTISRPGEMTREVVGGWIDMAERGRFRDIMIDTAEKSYSDGYLRRYRMLYPLLGLAKPKELRRFRIQAASCIAHDAHAELHRIACPTLVIGGACDHIVGAQASVDIAEEIAGSELHVYPGLGHAAYEEAKDFHARVLGFVTR